MTKMKNYRYFARAFPGQDRYQLGAKKQDDASPKRIDISFLPDTYFVTFCFNLILIISVLVYFFNTRNVKEEYLIRENISDIFNRYSYEDDDGETIPLTPYDRIIDT
mgnify:CR=1 FL=1